MSHLPLYGHHLLRRRLSTAATDGRLPASLLLQGRRGIGKQRLALWLGQYLLCDRATIDRLTEPCGDCLGCRYAERQSHPDLHWFFPRPALKDSDARRKGEDLVEAVKAHIAEAIEERMKAGGLWAPPSGMEGLHISTMRALVLMAALRPAMARRSVFVIGDAERLVTQEGSDQAANAFLKLLEEPAPGQTFILTTGKAGALLPTIRSRVVSVRVPDLAAADVGAFLGNQAVKDRFAGESPEVLLARANGAPGQLFVTESNTAAADAARNMLDSVLDTTHRGVMQRIKVAAGQGAAGGRGTFSDTLDALSLLLHARTRALVQSGLERDARNAAFALTLVEKVKSAAYGNVNPQLLSASLLTSLHRTLKP